MKNYILPGSWPLYVNKLTIFKFPKYHTSLKRNLFLDLILHSGSNVGIILLRDLIREQQLDAFTAARLVAYAGAYVKEPSEKLLLEFKTLSDINISGDGDQLGIYKSATVLAIASMVHKTCSGTSVCKSVNIDEWQKKYFNTVTST